MADNASAWFSGFALGISVCMYFLLLGMRATLSRLDRRIDLLLKDTDIDLAALAVQETQALMKAGRKIEAIKAYRDLTGCGLAEAKAFVESL